MSERKDGGLAFPHVGTSWVEPGMSLRDWFAGQAVHGLLAASSLRSVSAAAESYRIADAMLAARNAEASK